MPYSSDVQIVNDANGTAYGFLADNGLLFACQWNAQAQRWEKGEVVPGSEGARDLQALVVADLWPSGGAFGAVPGNAPGIVLAYRIGNGASAQVVASFGAWGSDGSLSWTQAQPLSSQQGDDEAFALMPAANGSFNLVLQKREATASPQELLAQFAENPSQLLSKQLDALSSGARKDSDLYESMVQINPTGTGGYALQLSAPGASPNSQSTPLTPATPTPKPTTPAPTFGGNTQLSRAVLAANAAPAPTLPSATRLAAGPTLLGAGAPGAAAPVAFAQPASASAGGSGFGFAHYFKNPANLAGLVLFPVRYSLGTAVGSSISKQRAQAGESGEYDSQEGDAYEANSALTDEELPGEDAPQPQIFSGGQLGSRSQTFSYSQRASSLSMNPLGGVRKSSEVAAVAGGAEKIEKIEKIEGVVSAASRGVDAQAAGAVAEGAAGAIYANPAQRDFTLSGAYGGQLAGRGGYSVVNFATYRYGKPALDSAQSANAGAYLRYQQLFGGVDSGHIPFGMRNSFSPGWKFGQGLAGSFKTLFQYSNPSSFQNATKLIGFQAQESLGWNLLAHKATYFDSGARFSLDLSLIASFLMEQRYGSADGLSRPLADTGLAVGALGNALSLLKTGLALGGLAAGNGRSSKDFSPITTNALYPGKPGFSEPSGQRNLRYVATAGGIGSLGLAIGIPVGVGASQMNADGTYSFGLGLQENVRARMLSKYGVGLEVIAGAQQNMLWTIGQGFAKPALQVQVFASVGAALPLGVFIPVIPTISWDYESQPPSTAAAAVGLAASSTAPVSRGLSITAPTGADYPMGYVPASATDALLALPDGPIASLLDLPTTLEWHQLQSFSASQLAPGLLEWSKNNRFAGLNDGTYSDVPLVGLSLPGSLPATASFTASGGVISNLVVQGARSLSLSGWISDGVLTLQAASDPGLQNGDAVTGPAVSGLDLPGPLLISGLAVAYDPTSQLVSYQLDQAVNLGSSTNPQSIAIETAQGQYLALPEPKSSRFVFGLDVFQQQSGNPAPPAVPTAGSVLDAMPLFSLQTSIGSNASPLSSANIQRIQQQLPISGLSQSGFYPKADGSLPAPNDSSLYTYSNVPIELLSSDGTGTPITPLNPGVTATVKLCNGAIVAITLDQPLYFGLPPSAYAGLPYTLVVNVEQALGNSGLVNPVITVTPQQQALNNFTDQDSFSANASVLNAGVFLSSGVSDQLPLLASYGRFPVQNRVSYLDGDTVVYLNNTAGSSASWKALSASDLELQAIYNNPASAQFTAASTPTAITDTASNTTYVFWVEASDPVIPLTGSDGEANYQAFMNALYGHQRINYSYATTSQAGTNAKWNYLNANDLYAPADTLITNLRSFAVQVDGVQRSLLVWTEVPISALKSAEANPDQLIDSQLAVIKAGLINPNAASTPGGYLWDVLFNDATGHSTIATIPWTSDRGSGLSIADLTAATLQVQVDPVARFTGTINGTTLIVSPLSAGTLAVGDLILGAGVKAGTTVIAITRAATASSAGSYQVSTSQTVSSTNLAAVPLSSEAASRAITFAGRFSGNGNSVLSVASGATALEVGDQLFGVGIEPGTFITAVLSLNDGTGAGSFLVNRGPATASGSDALLALPAGTPSPAASTTLTTPVLSWSEAVRTPYNEAVLASAPRLFVPMAGIQAGINSLNLGSAASNSETFASSTGLNTSIAGALPKSTATAVENVQGLGVLATGLGSFNSATLDALRNSSQPVANPAANPVAIFSGAINGTSLTIASVSQGTLAVGELVVGPGIPAGTTIAALPGSPNANQSGVYTLAYAPGADSSTVVAATTLRSLPVDSQFPLVSFQGSFSGGGGANGYTTLNIEDLSGTLQVGDKVLGLGLPGGSTIVQVISLDLNSGNAQVVVNQGPQSAGGSYGLASSTGGSSNPYTLEFWTQLDPGSNEAGAGLVALGQPSAAALPDRPVELPSGWLLSSSFGVEQLTWQDALNLGLEADLAGNTASDLYGWRWALRADGTNTTALNGTGGSNLYRNSLLLNNLLVGDTISGVDGFLAAYGLSSSDLTGFDGTPVDQIAASPTTQFQYSTAFSPNQALGGVAVPTTSLNGVAIDTSTAEMNGGIVLAAQAEANANLNAMFQTLWNFEQTYGQAKVQFSLNPLTQPLPPSANQVEEYGGYELQFVLQPGPAVSVNAAGQIAFDVAPGVTLVSADGIDYRDNGWHYVAASFLPDYATYSASGTTIELPRNVGTANLYVDGTLVASQADVVNPYAASNFNDAAQLLSDNAGGAIDLLAVYGQALSTSQPPAFASDWPMPTSTAGLALLQDVGFRVASKSPHPGQQPGAISNHYLAHTVDPNNAAQSTFTSALLPDASGGLSWSQATTLNPQAAAQPTTLSGSSPSLQSNLLIPIAATAWGQRGWYTNTTPTTAAAFNPAGQTLKQVTVTLTPAGGGAAVIRQLSPEEVLLDTTPLAALQPRAQDANYAYTFLSNAPALNLLISREPSGTGDSNTLDPKVSYNASVNLLFANGSSLSNTTPGSPAGTVLPLGFSTSLAATLKTQSSANSKALATADVLEEAPLQLQYIDSGVQLSSQNSPSDPTPASSFGSSQVYGSYANTGSNTNSGWLAISQPNASNATSDPAGRVWINFAGAFTISTDSQGNPVSSAVSDPAQAPATWLNALAASTFSPNRANLPLLQSALYQSSVGGLLIKADPSAGWGQNFGATMLVADVNNDGTDDLVIAAPQANDGGAVVIIDGRWIANNLTSSTGQTILDLSNPSNLGSWVTVLRPGNANSATDITTAAGFGTAMVFQSGSSGQPGTLWIGAPNYLRTLDASNAQDSTQPIGALYAYSTNAYAGSWGSATPTALSQPVLGSSGTVTIPQAGNGSSSSWWGAKLGTAVAISSSGELAVSAPGVVGAMVYTGTEALTDAYNNFNLNAKPELSSGLLYKLQLGPSPDATQGVDSSLFTPITGLQANNLSTQQKNFLTAFKNKMVNQVAGATMQNNQAIQAAAIGAVMVFKSSSNLSSLGGQVVTASGVNSLNGRTYYGPNPFNTLGDSGFGSSLSFADLTNTNSDQLIVGASQSGGGGLVYMLDPSANYNDHALGLNQYVAVLAATNVVAAAAASDDLGSGLVNLGDVNQDQIDDLLIQSYNASSSAGNGYVLFGSDQIKTSNKDQGLISLSPNSIGTIQYADGSSSSLAILTELGSAGGLTGQGTYGPGDYNADGLNDISLGSGPNAKGYLTWGHPYLASISDLQLSKLASNNGFLLDGLATTTQGSLRSIGDFNGDGYGDFISIDPGTILTTVRIELGANTQEILADAPYSYYTFTVDNGTQVLPAGDINGDGMADIALFLDQNLSPIADGNQGAGSTTGIFYGRSSANLPMGSGFGYIAPVNPATSAPLTPTPGLLLEGPDGEEGLTDATPAVIAVGDTLYAAVKGYGDNTLWFTESRDGGSSWDSWSELTSINSGFSTSTGPSLLAFGGKLYLSFVNSGGTLSLSSWDPGSTNPLAWSAPVALSDGASTAGFSSSSSPQLVDRGDSIGVLMVQDGVVWASTSTDLNSSSTTWSTPFQLQQITDGAAIAASDAPSYAWLGTSAVLAVNESGVIKVYGALAGTTSLQLVSTFTAPSGGPSITSAPVLTTSDTGLVLTYTNSDGSISVNRLELLSPNGTPLPGVSLTADGGVDVSEAAINWQSTVLTNANSGISSSLASTPVVVDGNLLLANVRNDSTPDNQIWLNAIPQASDPASTTWLNSTVQLADGNGGWSISQPAAGPLTSMAPNWSVLANGQSYVPPAFAEANGVLYTAVQGTNKLIYWNYSTDGGSHWGSWMQLPGGMSTGAAPALAVLNGTVVLAYLGNGNSEINITTAPIISGSPGSLTWKNQYQIPNQGAKTISMVTEGGSVALYYQGTNDNLYRTSTSTPASSSGWQENSVQYNNGAGTQTSSGQLVATSLNGTTYLAYQGGTTANVSNTIYLTASTSQSTGSSWSLIQDVPQPKVASHSGVGLSSFNGSLVFSYADQLNGSPVVALQQGVVSGGNWLGAPYALLQAVGGTNPPLASVFGPSGSNQLLVASINAHSAPILDITTALVSPQPLNQLLGSLQTGSTLTPVGDLNNDGFADLLVSAQNVAASTSSGRQLLTGLRVISGAATSSQVQANNDSTLSSQSVQLAQPFSNGSQVPVASITGADPASGSVNLSISARNGSSVAALNATVLPADLAAASGSVAAASSLLGGLPPTSVSLPPSQGWGDTALNGSGSYGDLNGDGRLDYFDPAGNARIDTGNGSIAYSLWSIRAAGDVNGNGVDDVLLSLVPKEAIYNGAPQDVQTVLVDGSLFKVDPTTNSFRLDQLRQPLNPFNRGEIADASSTSSTQVVPQLQNWLVPIQEYQPSIALNAFPTVTETSGSTAYNPNVYVGSDVGNQWTPSTAIADQQGNLYSVSLPISSSTSALTSGGTGAVISVSYANLIVNRFAPSGGSSAPEIACNILLPSGTNTLAPSGTAIYGDRLYVTILSGNAIELWSASLADLQSSTNATSLSSAQLVTLPFTTNLAPALVNEGDRLALYYAAYQAPSKNQGVLPLDTTLMAAYATQPEAGAGAWGTLDASGVITPGAGGEITTAANASASVWTGMPNLSATRFQGKTLIAYLSVTQTNKFNVFTAINIASSADDQAGLTGWNVHSLSPAISNSSGISSYSGISLTSNSTQLALLCYQSGVMTPENSTYTPPTPVASLALGSDYKTWSAFTDSNSGQVVGAAMVDSSLALIEGQDTYTAYGNGTSVNPYKYLIKSITTAINNVPLNQIGPARQVSLAGYSIDGNIDINGDGLKDMLVSDPSDPAKSVDNQYALFGGDYLNIATQVGTEGNDVIVGTALADVIDALQGSDQVDSNGGADVIYAGSGDDVISIVDNGFVRLDAGSGFDQLQLHGAADQSYDFRLDVASPQFFVGTKLRDIELISSLDYGANTLRFDAAAVNAINPDRILFLTPDALDSIVLTSEFQRNSGFDTTYAGVLWSAYTAGTATTPDQSNPTLVYVLNPLGSATTGWLDAHVLCLTSPPTVSAASTLAVTPATSGAPGEAAPGDSLLSRRSAAATPFGNGLTFVANSTTTASSAASFSIKRADASGYQVVSYTTTTRDSQAIAGRDYTVIAGLLVLRPGETTRQITVPLASQRLRDGRSTSVSLAVEEHPYNQQQELHLLLQAPTDTGDGSSAVLSGVNLAVDAAAATARISLRADTNTNGADPSLRLQIGLREHADDQTIRQSREISLRDFDPAAGFALSAESLAKLPLDADGRTNQQIQTSLELNFTASADRARVSVLGPEYQPAAAIERVGTQQIHFSQDTPLTTWRSDSGNDQVSFWLQAGGTTELLLADALGGRAGSINPSSAFDSNPTSGWRGSEGLAVGSRSIKDVPALSSKDWTPTATLDGRKLSLLEVSVTGNQVTAHFEGGVSVDLWQATGSAPAQVPVAPSVEVQRLAGYNNAIGFYSVDGITGGVDGRVPGDPGYLQAALARCEAEDLLLTAAKLPAFGATATYNTLPLDSQKSYGMLLLQNGDRQTIYSSFSDANPGRDTQMVRLGSDTTRLVFGIEDIGVTTPQSDRDFNDLIVAIRGVSLSLF